MKKIKSDQIEVKPSDASKKSRHQLPHYLIKKFSEEFKIILQDPVLTFDRLISTHF